MRTVSNNIRCCKLSYDEKRASSLRPHFFFSIKYLLKFVFLLTIFFTNCHVTFAGDPPKGNDKQYDICNRFGDINVVSYKPEMNRDFGVYEPFGAQLCAKDVSEKSGLINADSALTFKGLHNLPFRAEEIVPFLPSCKEKGQWGPMQYLCEAVPDCTGCCEEVRMKGDYNGQFVDASYCHVKDGCVGPAALTTCRDSGDICNPAEICNQSTGLCEPVSGGLDCKDTNACTVDGCDPATGCTHTDLNCNDNDACTTDSCNPASGCINTKINLNDGNACTQDLCDKVAGVSHPAVICNDNNACTIDSCNPATGCVFTPININDNNACTTDSCDPITGVKHTLIVCNDNNACTTDSCNPASGCVTSPVNCADADACTVDGCDPAIGCTHAPKDCNDNNICTVNDRCEAGTGNCVSDPRDCSAKSGICGEGQCDTAAGTHANYDAATGCYTEPANEGLPCPDGNLCKNNVCQNGSCVTVSEETCQAENDSNPCNQYACNPSNGLCEVSANEPRGTRCGDARNECERGFICDGNGNCIKDGQDGCVEMTADGTPIDKCKVYTCIEGATIEQNHCDYVYKDCSGQRRYEAGVCEGPEDACCDIACESSTGECVQSKHECPQSPCYNNIICDPVSRCAGGTGFKCDDNNICTKDDCVVTGVGPTDYQCLHNAYDAGEADLKQLSCFKCEGPNCVLDNKQEGGTTYYNNVQCDGACGNTSYNCDEVNGTCSAIIGTSGEYPDEATCLANCSTCYKAFVNYTCPQNVVPDPMILVTNTNARYDNGIAGPSSGKMTFCLPANEIPISTIAPAECSTDVQSSMEPCAVCEPVIPNCVAGAVMDCDLPSYQPFNAENVCPWKRVCRPEGIWDNVCYRQTSDGNCCTAAPIETKYRWVQVNLNADANCEVLETSDDFCDRGFTGRATGIEYTPNTSACRCVVGSPNRFECPRAICIDKNLETNGFDVCSVGLIRGVGWQQPEEECAP